MPYKIKRAQTQSVKIKQGVLVAWQGGNSNPVMTAVYLGDAGSTITSYSRQSLRSEILKPMSRFIDSFLLCSLVHRIHAGVLLRTTVGVFALLLM